MLIPMPFFDNSISAHTYLCFTFTTSPKHTAAYWQNANTFHLVSTQLKIVIWHKSVERLFTLGIKRHIGLPAKLRTSAVFNTLWSLAGSIHVQRVEQLFRSNIEEGMQEGALRSALHNVVPIGPASADGTIHHWTTLEPVLLVIRHDSRCIQLVVADVDILGLALQLCANKSDKKQPQNRRHAVRVTPNCHCTKHVTCKVSADAFSSFSLVVLCMHKLHNVSLHELTQNNAILSLYNNFANFCQRSERVVT